MWHALVHQNASCVMSARLATAADWMWRRTAWPNGSPSWFDCVEGSFGSVRFVTVDQRLTRPW
jgi:hypothetical protein